MREVNQNFGPAALPSAMRRVNRHSSRSCLTAASFIASLRQERNASAIFPVACALFAKKCRGVASRKPLRDTRVSPTSHPNPRRPSFPIPNAAIPGFSRTENCLLKTDDSPSHAAGYILPSSATIKGLVLQNLSSAGTDMALKCDLCGKGPQYGNVVSHANNTRRRRWNPNLKRVRAVVAGTHKHLRVCTACIRAGKVIKAGASRAPKAA